MSDDNKIAIVGMAGRFPRSPDLREYWKNVRGGVECLTPLAEQDLLARGVDRGLLMDPSYIRVGGILPDMEGFDAGFFNFSPRDAAIMDPQHRHFLEVAWEALEDAGYDPARFNGNIGVFGGSGHNAYLPYNLLTNPELVASVGLFLLRHTGNDKDFLTTRVSYCLDLRGPSVNVQTACSTSLVAVHLACQSLLSGECDMALAGGVTIEMPHGNGYKHEEGHILSPDGHCRAFDHRSEGTVFSSGVGIVVLRRLADARDSRDTVRAVIIGSAINNDGSNKVGYLAPSVDGQASAIAEAIALAGVGADEISYVEAHGTGTPVGDPIEVSALTQAFRQTSDGHGYCGLGSVKTNLGHTDNAAGVASLIKVVQALEHHELPPTIHFEKANPSIDFSDTPFFVQSKHAHWATPPGKPRRAGVNSLGVGGTNAFVVLEEAPPSTEPSPSRPVHLLISSARSAEAANLGLERLATHLAENTHQPLADIASTLQIGRRAFAHRRAVVCRKATDLVEAVSRRDASRLFAQVAPDAAQQVVFMFPGGGAQYPEMGRELYELAPVYRAEFDRCLEHLRGHVGDIRSLIFPTGSEIEVSSRRLESPSFSLPALFATEYALAKLWMSWGVTPVAMLGHSMGEYTAACLAGVFSLEDAIALVSLRGRLFEKVPPSGMLSVPLSPADLNRYLGSELSLAAVNGSSMTVASGPNEAIAELQRRLASDGVEFQPIHISIAAHSKMLDPILEEFGRFTRTIRYAAPRIPFASNVTGRLISASEATDPSYWVQHLRSTVRFVDGLDAVLAEPNRVLLEVGPGRTLSTLGRIRASELGKATVCLNSLRHPKEAQSDLEYVTGVLGRLWVAGVDVDWNLRNEGEQRQRVPLPTYPWQHERHWIEPGKTRVTPTPPSLAKKPDIRDWFHYPAFKRKPLIPQPVNPTVFLLIGGDAFADELAGTLRRRGHRAIIAHSGEDFEARGPDSYRISPRSRQDLERLLATLSQDGCEPHSLVHLISLETPAAGTPQDPVDGSFSTMLALGQALGSIERTSTLELTVVTHGAKQVAGEAVLHPEHAMASAASRVLMQEVAFVSARSIDIEVRPSVEPLCVPWTLTVAEELEASPVDRNVAYRGRDRLVQSLEPIQLGEALPSTSRLREHGIYLITGGLGGIGLELASHLARTHHARLVLVGRRGLPEAAVRQDWLATHDVDDPTSIRIRKIAELEHQGGEALVLAADVTDLASMKLVVEAAYERFGGLDGVFHTAGVLDDGIAALKSIEGARAVLAPKVSGVLALDAALQGRDLDFMVLFSSVSGLTGLAGQIDYAAANAFLDAFAYARTSRTSAPCFAIDWNAWRDVGMAAELAVNLGITARKPRPLTGKTTTHPWLERLLRESPTNRTYSSLPSAERCWILGEHKLRSGEAVMPGTGYLELVRAAHADIVMRAAVEAGASAISVQCEMEQVVFIEPFVLERGEARELRLILEPRGDGSWDFVFSGGGAPDGVEYARGIVRGLVAPPRGLETLASIAARCSKVVRETFRLDTDPHLAFGPRWDNRVRLHCGDREALIELQLAREFAEDVTILGLHPALLDFATAGAQELIAAFDASKDFYVPMSYGRLRAFRPIPSRAYSHVRLRPGAADQEIATFDVSLFDEDGALLVDIEEFTMRRVAGAALSSPRISPQHRARRSTASTMLDLGMQSGIDATEGMEALERILAGPRLSQIIVSSQDLQALLEHATPAALPDAAKARQEEPAPSVRSARPPLATEYSAPATDLEKTVAAIWEELLGIQGVGRNDDFFDLGGHSLLLTQLVSRVRKRTATEIGLRSLFEKRTIASIAGLLETSRNADSPAAPTLKRLSRGDFLVRRSTLSVGSGRDDPERK